MKKKYIVRNIKPEAHSFPSYICRSDEEGLYMGYTSFPKDLAFFDSKEDALACINESFSKHYVEIVEVYIPEKF